MPSDVKQIRCLLMSPNDVGDEREAANRAVNEWNAHIGEILGARVELVRWETHSVPDLSGKPQTVLNKQIVDDCEIGIAIFWSRLGTPTDEFSSGTIEEIARLREGGRHVLVYFKNSPIPQPLLDGQQVEDLKKARQDLQNWGIVSEFDGVDALKFQLMCHLTEPVSNLLNQTIALDRRTLNLIDEFNVVREKLEAKGLYIQPPPSIANLVQKSLTPKEWEEFYLIVCSRHIRALHSSCMYFEAIAAQYREYEEALEAHRREFLKWYKAAIELIPTVFNYMPEKQAKVHHAYYLRLMEPNVANIDAFFGALNELKSAMDSGEVIVSAD
jgi:hypothetical protein